MSNVYMDILCLIYCAKNNIRITFPHLKEKAEIIYFVERKCKTLCSKFNEVCKYGDERIVKYYMKLYSKKRNFIQTLDYSVYSAAEKGHTHIIKILFDNGSNQYFNTILIAIKYGYLDMLILLQKYVSHEYSDPYLLCDACMYDHEHIVKYLLNRGINSSIALSYVCHTRKRKYVNLLIEHGGVCYNTCLDGKHIHKRQKK